MAELFKVNAPVRKPLFEGVQGENEARSIQFDITPWVEELGDGAVTATAKRSQDSQPYPVTVTKDGTTVTWKPTSTDTAYAGVGSFQLEYTVDSVLAKTCIWSTMVAPSLDPAGDPPDPYDNWLAEMRQIAADALQDAQDADASAKTSEAWAVGQRGGVDVPSTDPTYENNAKYWAEQAEELKDSTQAIVDEARADVFEAMDGLHEETTAGSALQLISDKRTVDKVPYLFRTSGGGKSIGNREFDTLVGGSVAWNQLVSGTATSVTVPSGHKYIAYIGGTRSIGASTGAALSVTGGTDTVHDLTQMFGSTIADYIYSLEQAEAGAGVAFFRKLFPKPYYAYNAGELMSVKTTAHETVGFNAFDVSNADLQQKAWENVYTVSQNVHTEGYTKVIGGQNYCFHQNIETQDRYIRFYDADYNFLESETLSIYNNNDYVFTVPADAMYLRLMWYDANGVSVAEVENGEITINLSWSGWRNGEYEPYQKHSYALDDSLVLRGIPKLDAQNNLYYDGDTYEPDGTVTRKWGFYTIQTSDITLDDGGGYTNIVCAKIQNLPSMLKSNLKQAIHSKYGVSQVVWPFDDTSKIGKLANNPADTAYWFIFPIGTTIEQMRTTLVGTTLVYELATPATETADPYTNPQIVDDFGTERYVDEREVAVPVGHVTKYPDNLREKLDGLPWDFSSLIAPTEKTYTATRNYTTGSLFIVGNILYKATANIANGGTITPNTNCTATTLAEVISAL